MADYSPAFEAAFERTIGHEGHTVSYDYDDRGNWTSGEVGKGEFKGSFMGVSAMSYPHLDIAGLTVEDVKEIYWEDWWKKLGMDKWREPTAFQVFDSAINHGHHRTICFLQEAVHVKVDGIVGPITRGAVADTDLDVLLFSFLALRLQFITNISTWDTFGKGWTRRIASNLKFAADDIELKRGKG